MAEKVEEYLSTAVDRVWVVSLRRRTVQILCSTAEPETLEGLGHAPERLGQQYLLLG